MKILILEDDKDILKALISRFNKRGDSPYPCENLAEALEYLKNTKPDLILADLNLKEDESGWGFYLNHVRGKQILFILTSGGICLDKKILLQNKEDRFFYFLEKPYSFDTLIKILNSQS